MPDLHSSQPPVPLRTGLNQIKLCLPPFHLFLLLLRILQILLRFLSPLLSRKQITHTRCLGCLLGFLELGGGLLQPRLLYIPTLRSKDAPDKNTLSFQRH